MLTLMETSLSHIPSGEFTSHIIEGLADQAHDIKILSQVMLQKLGRAHPNALKMQASRISELLRKILETKPKANAVKQELEKYEELVHTTVKTVVLVESIGDIFSDLVLYTKQNFAQVVENVVNK